MLNRLKHTVKIVLKVNSFIFFMLLCKLSHADTNQSLIIGFGSCADQNWKQPIWNNIIKHKPELFILMGDNVYIDSKDPKKMANAYEKLAKIPEFINFKQKTPLLATWDDHDYAERDGGKDFVGKHDAKEAFIEFFDYPELNQTSQHGGIYHSRWLQLDDKQIQIIMLDTRWYRDSLVNSYLTMKQLKTLNLGGYQPTLDKQTTLLGAPQWLWLEKELQKPADLKVLVSSIQVINDFSGWETWANFPHEREKLLNLLVENTNDNLLILSGDVHRAEISTIEYKNHSFVDVTSSGLATKTYPAGFNKYRVGNALNEKNYGILSISIDENLNNKLTVTSTIYNDKAEQKLTMQLGKKND